MFFNLSVSCCRFQMQHLDCRQMKRTNHVSVEFGCRRHQQDRRHWECRHDEPTNRVFVEFDCRRYQQDCRHYECRHDEPTNRVFVELFSLDFCLSLIVDELPKWLTFLSTGFLKSDHSLIPFPDPAEVSPSNIYDHCTKKLNRFANKYNCYSKLINLAFR